MEAINEAPAPTPAPERTFMNHDGVTTQIGGDGARMTAAEAIHGAGLDWRVGLVDAGFRVRGGIFKPSQDGRKAVCRLDENGTPVQDFGYVGKNYRPIQNVEKFDFADAMVEGGANFEAAWSMRGGQEVGLLLSFPDDIEVAGDPYAKKLLLRGSHTGAGSVTAATLMLRLYCTNQLDSAMRGANRVVRIAHLGNASMKFAAARESLLVSNAYQEAFVGSMEALAQRSISDELSDTVVRAVLEGQRFGGLDDKVAAILELRRSSPTIQDEFRPTMYGLVQASTEWLDWVHKGKTPASKLHDTLDGRIHKAKNELMSALANV